MKEITIQDDYGNDYKIKNLKKFKNHIIEFHSKNGEGDNSLHVENGKYFKVTKAFYKKILSLGQYSNVLKIKFYTLSQREII